ncbi:MAG: SDR family NAD(P)-dependent oxidoreductase [Aquabacterium sp.]|uniref:SDR family NAD(P)-dependent oxidoreductase n=1 Tax=Aquabacterium sp. TaxID=1872578 RepID=UPI0025BF803B|nr:SDR family NAD(P)-dependent oxidoreductase [Aquabacterium sp.]MBI3383768.1 SDR family NAD(P)-dependent oxidoreductase [Aquabacterium sp.]
MAIPNLRDKWVVVTGAASGIGYETALAFARRGANIYATDLNQAGLDDLSKALIGLGVRHHLAIVDVANEAAMRALAQEVQDKVGAPHVLVNNAGTGYMGPFLHTPMQAWRRLLDVNLMGVVHGCYYFLPAMKKAGGARHVVNVASAAGITPSPNLSAYSATKHAVMGLNDNLSIELDGTGIGVTAVCPGVINTPIIRNRKAVSPVIPSEQLDKLEGYYRSEGAHPAIVGTRIVQAVQRGEDIVLVGPTARPMFHIKRLSRRLMRLLTIEGCKRNGFIWPYTLPERSAVDTDQRAA